MPPEEQTELMRPSLNDVPAGYTMGVLQDGRQYLIPQTFLADLHQGLLAHRSKVDDKIISAEPKFAQCGDLYQEKMAGLFQYPCDPLPSNQERLEIHAEIKALQQQLGILYKDASHRLYMAEMAKLKMADKEAKSWANLAALLEQTCTNLDIGLDDKMKADCLADELEDAAVEPMEGIQEEC